MERGYLLKMDFMRQLDDQESQPEEQDYRSKTVAPFLALDNLKPFIDSDLIDSTKPIKFIPDKGWTSMGI